jgi:hypothetical protein
VPSPSADPFSRQEMQEHFYKSGNGVQIICAILGVHPTQSGTTWEQLGQIGDQISWWCGCKGKTNQEIAIHEESAAPPAFLFQISGLQLSFLSRHPQLGNI